MTVIETLISLICGIILGLLLGSSIGRSVEKDKAIAAGVAYYSANPTNGKVTFIYTNNIPKL